MSDDGPKNLGRCRLRVGGDVDEAAPAADNVLLARMNRPEAMS